MMWAKVSSNFILIFILLAWTGVILMDECLVLLYWTTGLFNT